MSGLARFVRVHETVAAAIAAGRACVALESTIITHGLPYPTNLRTALACEAAVREAGAVPATIALLDGVAHVGLQRSQLERLAASANSSSSSSNQGRGAKAVKASRRDLAAVLASGTGSIGGTTVSGTMVIAHHAGIPVFATGGIGGVHRGAETSMDISADLTELSRTPVAVFCSGAKSILSLPLTLEYLETAGVTVASFGPQGAFPAFYAAESGLKVTAIRDVDHAARIIDTSLSLGLKNGMVFGIPIPDSHSHAGEEIQRAVEQAVRESVDLGIDKKGKEVTPWLLARVSQLTDKALESNAALVINNSRVAALTAVSYSKLRDTSRSMGSSSYQPVDQSSSFPPRDCRPHAIAAPTAVVVVGCAAVDISARPGFDGSPANRSTTYPGCINLSPGGVARNIAEAATRLLDANLSPRSQQDPSSELQQDWRRTPLRHSGAGRSLVRLIAPVADDAFGHYLRQDAGQAGMREDGFFTLQCNGDTAGEQSVEARTAVCSLFLTGSGDLQSGVADFDIVSRIMPVHTSTAQHNRTPAVERGQRSFSEHLQASLRQLSDTAVSASAPGLHPVIAFDANFGPDFIVQIISTRDSNPEGGCRPTLIYEPTSLPKCGAAITAMAHLEDRGDRLIDICTPNVAELLEMHRVASEAGLLQSDQEMNSVHVDAAASGLTLPVFSAAQDLCKLFSWIFLKRGGEGVTVFRQRCASFEEPSFSSPSECKHYSTPSPLDQADIVSTTGAGDTFAGALVAGVAMFGPPANWPDGRLSGIVGWAQRAAAQTVLSSKAVAEQLSTSVYTP